MPLFTKQTEFGLVIDIYEIGDLDYDLLKAERYNFRRDGTNFPKTIHTSLKQVYVWCSLSEKYLPSRSILKGSRGSKISKINNSFYKKHLLDSDKVWFSNLFSSTTCYYTGLNIDPFRLSSSLISLKEFDYLPAQVDRKVPNLGYTYKNSVLASIWANLAKNSLTSTEFTSLLKTFIYKDTSYLSVLKQTWSNKDTWHTRLVSTTKEHCKKLKKPFPYSSNYEFKEVLFHKLKEQSSKCYYTSLPLPSEGFYRHPLNISIDRIDSLKGYEKENIVLCNSFINLGRCITFSNYKFYKNWINTCLLDSLKVHLKS